MVQTMTVSVDGMTCDGCASNVAAALNSLDDVNSADVSHETGTVVITHSGSSIDDIKLAIQGAGYSVGGEAAPFDWSDGPIWRQSAHNTKWCLVGCSIGDFGTIAAFQFVFTESGWSAMMIMALAMFNGIMTSIALETYILSAQMALREAFRVAIGMSLISMLSMEAAMNVVDLVLTGGAKLTWWVILPMLVAGFLTPWPYNYWRLKKHGVACH